MLIRRFLVRFGFAVSVLSFLPACATPEPASPVVYRKDIPYDSSPKRVIIVSFDGLRPDAIDAAGAVHIRSVSEAGVSARNARTVLPAITLVSHASMLSGVSPKKHGIDWNFYVPGRGAIAVPTVFDAAKKKGLRTAMVVGKEKFNHLVREGTVDRFVFEDGSGHALAEDAIRVLREDRPQLLFVHFAHPDWAGHRDGWMSKSQFRAIREADRGLGEILAALKELGLESSTTLILTADHGGSDRGHGEDSDVSRRIPWIAAGPGVPRRGTIEKPIDTYDTAATAAKLLGLERPKEWEGNSVF